MKLFLVRHGETEDNVQKILQGHKGGKLTKEGLEQAKKLALRLKNEKIDAIFSSDLKRCKDTTEEIAKFHNGPVYYRHDLRERLSGIFEGRPSEEMRKAREMEGKKRHEFKPENGENYIEVSERASKFLRFLLEKYKNKTVLICSHGGFNKVLLGIIMEKPLDESTFELEQNNCCINLIEIKSGQKYEICLLNNTEHLQPQTTK